jgi:hypothetical protein
MRNGATGSLMIHHHTDKEWSSSACLSGLAYLSSAALRRAPANGQDLRTHAATHVQSMEENTELVSVGRTEIATCWNEWDAPPMTAAPVPQCAAPRQATSSLALDQCKDMHFLFACCSACAAGLCSGRGGHAPGHAGGLGKGLAGGEARGKVPDACPVERLGDNVGLALRPGSGSSASVQGCHAGTGHTARPQHP